LAGEDFHQKIFDCGGTYPKGGMGASAPIIDQNLSMMNNIA
jgi:hypothetical protein